MAGNDTGKEGATARPVRLTPSEYNFLRIHTLLTTVAKEACQYLLHKRLKKLEEKKHHVVSEEYKRMQATYEKKKKTLEEEQKDFQDALDIQGYEFKKIVLDMLEKQVENRKKGMKALSLDKSRLHNECKELGDAVKQGFDDLKCRIIRLCVLQQEETQKGVSGIVNDATRTLKALKPKFEKAIEAFREGKRSSQDFACLSLEITLIITLLKSWSLFKEDQLIFPEDKGEKRKPNDAHKSTAHVDDATSGQSLPTETTVEPAPGIAECEEEHGHQAEAGMVSDEQLKRKTKENKAAREIYTLRNYMSHLEFIDCMDDEEEYERIMKEIDSCSRELVDDEELRDSFKTKYDQIEALGQAELKSDPSVQPYEAQQPTSFGNMSTGYSIGPFFWLGMNFAELQCKSIGLSEFTQ